MLISAFGLTYAFSSPLAGWLIDRAGLARGMTLFASLWSMAGIATGWSGSLKALAACRMLLGAGESAGIPALAKANATWLDSRSWAFSLAANNIAIAAGSAAAPLLVAALTPRWPWRSVFFVTGIAGLLWIPIWILTTRRIPPAPPAPRTQLRGLAWKMLHDRRLWGVTLSNALIMTVYTVWTNWTTLYFVQQLHLTEADANRHYAWLPPIFAMLGGFAGGYLTWRSMGRGMSAVTARLRGCWIAAGFLLLTATLPLFQSPVCAAAVISVTMFWAMSLQMNVHILPVDIFGHDVAGLSVSVLACSYGLVQALISPLVGATVDRFGFPAVCFLLSVLPMAGVWILKRTLRTHLADSGASPAMMSAHA
jgi:ACS family hexuronate transporter-like MFS transporter